MDEKPAKRRWFRFRLSTVLILTAILAWATRRRRVACRPYVVFYEPTYVVQVGNTLYSDGGDMPNRALKWPALTLTVFGLWKVAWAIGNQHRAPEQAASLFALGVGGLVLLFSAVWLLWVWLDTLPTRGIAVPRNPVTWDNSQSPILAGIFGLAISAIGLVGFLFARYRQGAINSFSHDRAVS